MLDPKLTKRANSKRANSNRKADSNQAAKKKQPQRLSFKPVQLRDSISFALFLQGETKALIIRFKRTQVTVETNSALARDSSILRFFDS